MEEGRIEALILAPQLFEYQPDGAVMPDASQLSFSTYLEFVKFTLLPLTVLLVIAIPPLAHT